MSDIIIYDPEIRINNTTVAKVGNTASITSGKGESMNSPQSTGNGEVSMVYSEDVTTKFSIFKFSVKSTAANMNLLLELKENKNDNYITVNDPNSNTNYVLKQAAMTNDPEMLLGNDGEAEFEFHCKPLE